MRVASGVGGCEFSGEFKVDSKLAYCTTHAGAFEERLPALKLGTFRVTP
jgi:hypothetical protein